MKEIGGFFGLELLSRDQALHPNALNLNSGRNSLEYILLSLPQISRILIPYFTCDSVLEPIIKIGIPYDFYRIDRNLEILDRICLDDDEYLLYTNYFGIKDEYVIKLLAEYASQIIIDNSQALFAPHSDLCLYSPRKFVGVPDGGFAYTSHPVCKHISKDRSYNRCSHLLKRIDIGASNAFAEYKENSEALCNQPIMLMSDLTEYLLNSIDFNYVKQRRLRNFEYLHSILKSYNIIRIPDIRTFSCPMVYPFRINGGISLRSTLIEHQIYVARYWPNVLEWCQPFEEEYCLTEEIVALPIDQRYGIEDMEVIIKLIKKWSVEFI